MWNNKYIVKIAESALSKYLEITKNKEPLPSTDAFSQAVQYAIQQARDEVKLFNRRCASKERIYNKWIDNIVEDTPRMEDLICHIHKHVDEVKDRGVTKEWLASMLNLIEIVSRKSGVPIPNIITKLHRLYLHWKRDIFNMTPPPDSISFSKMIKLGLFKRNKGL